MIYQLNNNIIAFIPVSTNFAIIVSLICSSRLSLSAAVSAIISSFFNLLFNLFLIYTSSCSSTI